MLRAKQSTRLFSSQKYVLGTDVRKPGSITTGTGKKDGRFDWRLVYILNHFRNPLVDRIPAVLQFKSGLEVKGWSIGSTNSANGELVFNTVEEFKTFILSFR